MSFGRTHAKPIVVIKADVYMFVCSANINCQLVARRYYIFQTQGFINATSPLCTAITSSCSERYVAAMWLCLTSRPSMDTPYSNSSSVSTSSSCLADMS